MHMHLFVPGFLLIWLIHAYFDWQVTGHLQEGIMRAVYLKLIFFDLGFTAHQDYFTLLEPSILRWGENRRSSRKKHLTAHMWPS